MSTQRKRGRDSDSAPSLRVLCPPFVLDYAPYAKGQLNLTRRRQLTDCGEQWDTYYRNNTVNGYKDRHYLLREFHELREALDLRSSAATSSAPSTSGDVVLLLEVGCGVGNALLPIVEQYIDRLQPSEFQVYGFDISEVAVKLLQAKLVTDTSSTEAAVLPPVRSSRLAEYVHCCAHDLTQEPLPVGCSGAWLRQKASFATIIFVLCSIKEVDRRVFVERMSLLIAEGGLVFVRDYAVGDHAQSRFASRQAVEDDTFLRTNGTLSHFFSAEAMQTLFESCGFDTVECKIVEREVTNRREDVTMSRRFVQGKFRRRRT